MAAYPILKPGTTDHDHIYDLPDGWSKRITQRQGGASLGAWDAYLMPPIEYKHKRLRSVVELMEFLIKHRDCEIDPRHVNLEKTPEIVMGPIEMLNSSTKKLMEFVKVLKSGAEINIQDFVRKKPPKEKTDGSSKVVKRKRTKKSKTEDGQNQETLEPIPPQFDLSQILKLEKMFHYSVSVPTPEQVILLAYFCSIQKSPR
jgi:hypothetical protein